jgi:hypothetical protein
MSPAPSSPPGLLGQWLALADERRLEPRLRGLFVSAITLGLDHGALGPTTTKDTGRLLSALLQLQPTSKKPDALFGVEPKHMDDVGGRLFDHLRGLYPKAQLSAQHGFGASLALPGMGTFEALWSFEDAPRGKALTRKPDSRTSWSDASLAESAVSMNRLDVMVWMKDRNLDWAGIPHVLMQAKSPEAVAFLLECGCDTQTPDPAIGVENHWRREVARRQLGQKAFEDMQRVLASTVSPDLAGRQTVFFEQMWNLPKKAFSQRVKDAGLDEDSEDFHQRAWAGFPDRIEHIAAGGIAWAAFHPVRPGDTLPDGRPMAARFMLDGGYPMGNNPLADTWPTLDRFIPGAWKNPAEPGSGKKAGQEVYLPEGNGLAVFSTWFGSLTERESSWWPNAAEALYDGLLETCQGDDLALVLSEGLQQGLVRFETWRQHDSSGTPQRFNRWLEALGRCPDESLALVGADLKKKVQDLLGSFSEGLDPDAYSSWRIGYRDFPVFDFAKPEDLLVPAKLVKLAGGTKPKAVRTFVRLATEKWGSSPLHKSAWERAFFEGLPEAGVVRDKAKMPRL